MWLDNQESLAAEGRWRERTEGTEVVGMARSGTGDMRDAGSLDVERDLSRRAEIAVGIHHTEIDVGEVVV